MSQSPNDLTIAATLNARPDLTIAEVTALKPLWLRALDDSAHLVLDLAAVEQFDLAGAQLLLLMQREAGAQGKQLQLAHGSDVVRELFKLLRIFDDAFPCIVPDALADATAAELFPVQP